MKIFSKKQNKNWRNEGCANSLLAEYLDVDFEVTEVKWIPGDDWLGKLKSGEVSSDELAQLAANQYNIVKEIQIRLRAIKS